MGRLQSCGNVNDFAQTKSYIFSSWTENLLYLCLCLENNNEKETFAEFQQTRQVIE